MKMNEYIQSIVLKQLNNEISAAEQAELQQWLDSDTGNRQEYDEWTRIWKNSAEALLQQPFDTARAWEKVLPELKGPPIPEAMTPKTRAVDLFSRRKLAAASVTIVIASAGLWYYWQHRTGNAQQVLAKDSNQQVTLPDGSVVYLRKGSSLEYAASYNHTDRTVALTGEAFFEVRHDPNNPFIITTTHSVIEDIGTSFLVRNQTGADEVMVVSGKVKFAEKRNPANSITLIPDQQVVLEEKTFSAPETADSNSLAWKTGILNYVNSPLNTVFQDISHFYQVEVRVDASVRDTAQRTRITARFEKMSMDQALQELTLITGFAVNREGNNIIFYRK